MTYYIRCPKCGEMIEASYKPAYHVCYECGHKHLVTENNSMKKPPVYLIAIVGVFLMFVGAGYSGLVYDMGYPRELLSYAFWYTLGGGALCICAILLQENIERMVMKNGIKRVRVRAENTRAGNSAGLVRQNHGARYNRSGK